MADKNPAHAEDSSLFEVVRVSRDGKSAIVKHPSEGVYTALSLETGQNLFPSVTEFSEIVSKGSWRKVSTEEVSTLVASIEAASFEIMTEISSGAKPYRVPAAVQEEIREALTASGNGFTTRDIKIATSLAYDEAVGRTEVEWIDEFFDHYEKPQRLRGGYKGQKWASRILNPQTDEDYFFEDESTEKVYDFDDEVFAYYAASSELDSPIAEELLAIDYTTGAVYLWGINGFEVLDGTDMAEIEAPTLTLIDQSTAEALARYLDSGDEQPFNTQEADPYEWNLFALAESEIDFEELDRVSSLIAAGVGKYGGIDLDPNDYTPEERSINAKRQVRGQGGKFGGPQIKPGAKLLGFTKARLAKELPLVSNPAGRIQEFIANAPVTAAGAPETAVTDGAANPNPAPAAPVEPVQAEAVEKAQPAEGAAILYFAIVDNADKTAVLNVVGITKSAEGQPEAYMRENAAWSLSAELLGQLMGATPPPVVELAVPEPAKNVLAQIDEHDATKEQFPTDAIPNDPKKEEAVVASAALRGYALPSGELMIFDVDDLQSAITEFASLDESTQLEAKEHIRKRARALNRLDLVPEDYRFASIQEIGELQAKTSPLYSTFGELLPSSEAIVASAKSGHRGNTETLMNYWAFGKGALKIRWGTKGDLTRAHRHLTKYLGSSERAWGMAQNLHKRIFGVSNITHDRATGQYEGRRRK